MSHKKFGPDRFSRFDVYWIQTDRQTNKQTDKPRYVCFTIKHFLSSNKAIWKFSSQLNLVYFVLILELSNTFFEKLVPFRLFIYQCKIFYYLILIKISKISMKSKIIKHRKKNTFRIFSLKLFLFV